MRQAQMLREQMETMQKSLDKEIVEGTAGGGMVKAAAESRAVTCCQCSSMKTKATSGATYVSRFGLRWMIFDAIETR